MDYDTYKDLEQDLAEAVGWAEDVVFSADREGNDTFLIVDFLEEDEDGAYQPSYQEKYKLVKVED